jgi:hypothetical protein
MGAVVASDSQGSDILDVEVAVGSSMLVGEVGSGSLAEPGAEGAAAVEGWGAAPAPDWVATGV